jgi:hypothetical protein
VSAVATRPSKADQAAELEQLRAEVAELRQALRAVAGLAFGIGIRQQPQTQMAAAVTSVEDICRIYGVSGQAHIIKQIFG